MVLKIENRWRAAAQATVGGKGGELVVVRCVRTVGGLAQAIYQKSERIHISGLYHVEGVYAS